MPLSVAEVALAAVTRMAGTQGRAVLRQLPALVPAIAAGGGAQVRADYFIHWGSHCRLL